MEYRKGQAAIEYLLSYGWAIMVLVIVIGLIVSTGVFSPSYFVPEQCDLGPNLPCEFSLFTDAHNTNLIVRIRNSFSHNVALESFTMRSGTRDFSLSSSFPLSIESGNSVVINGIIPGYIESPGVLKKVNISLKYFSCEDVVNPSCSTPDTVNIHRIDGKIFANVQQQ